ncbi:MAG: hypothetical protein OEO77_14270, partial [Acidimicrobiia bacterium]|nr:hypothetical protein [Acidimicrobiia bacterium]
DGATQLVMGGAGDNEWLRLTKAPTADVEISVLTDGLVDVVGIGGAPVTTADYDEIGGYVPTRLFRGTVDIDGPTITRGTGSDLGSFIEEGFFEGDFLRIAVPGSVCETGCDVYVLSVTESTITLTAPLGVTADEYADVTLNLLVRTGLWQGTVGVSTDPNNDPDWGRFGALQVVRTLADADLGYLADGFLEGQWVRICDGAANCVDVKIDLIRGENDTKDSTLQFTLTDPFSDLPVSAPAWLAGSIEVTITRIAPVLTFTAGACTTAGGGAGDWCELHEVEFSADQYYLGLPGRENVKVFPATTHYLSRLQGPLAVEGGVVPGADRTLRSGVKLPGETDGPLFNIAAQAPESTQIDVLNVFDDSSQQDKTGTMTQTSISGFGMAEELNFLELDPSLDPDDILFGESPIVPGGITYGAVVIDADDPDATFSTNAAQSTLEVVNLMMGEGNDHLVIEGTIDPKTPAEVSVTVDATYVADVTGGLIVPVEGVRLVRSSGSWLDDGYTPGENVTVTGVAGLAGTWQVVDVSSTTMTLRPRAGATLPGGLSDGDPIDTATDITVAEAGAVEFTGAVTIVDGDIGTYFDITRTDAGDWAADGFDEGQQIMIIGEPGTWRIIDIDGATMTVAPLTDAEPLTPGTTTLTIQVAGRHGGLTVVHGGGNIALELENAVLDLTAGTGHDVDARRIDGLAWVDDGYRVGQRITLDGVLYEIVGFAGTTTDCSQLNPFAACGIGSIAQLDTINGSAGNGAVVSDVAVVDPLVVSISGGMAISVDGSGATPTSTLTCTGCDFLAAGFRVGLVVTVSGIAGPFTVGAVTATTLTLQGAALTPTIAEPTGPTYFTVELTVIGTDSDLAGLVRMGGDTIVLDPAPGGVLGGPDSPLVLYGDTSQDGVWYSGDPATVDGRVFGDKPFNPFVDVPIDENEDAQWVFPVANEYTNAGNDVIDASALFAGLTAAELPTVGVTIYGGEGDDIILGSQTGDHLAGGSGNDLILGQRGTDHIYGDSGINVDILTRGLTIPTTNSSAY